MASVSLCYRRQLSNTERIKRFKGKAGVNRWLGKRPRVRGVAMVPSGHPHGGGSKAKGVQRHPKTYWGVFRAGLKTRAGQKPLGLIMRRRMSGRQMNKFKITRNSGRKLYGRS